MGSLAFDKIRLAGFKSFVDSTDFIIEPGLTGIVGPNGCGKSNLLEAIRWVMGANSAKAMRGSAMDDVIFAGTRQRPGRNQAHVMLTIDNRSRLAPPMFNDDDTLEVTRLITKGKGSKYRVNGQSVRAKDIQLLFADASTGANSPALVRQGQINELISAKPENRRRILEEAAGISGLHTRRHEAELRLRAAETNLSRLDDVVGQIESQLLSLRRQSRQAARYKRLAGEIHEYKALLWQKRWEQALKTLQDSQAALSHCETDLENKARTSAELTKISTELATHLDPKREEQIIAAAVLGRLNAAKDALEQDEASAISEIKKLESQIKNLDHDIERESGIVADATDAISRLTLEFETLTALKDTSAAIDAAADDAERAISRRSALEQDYNALTRQSADQNARRDAAQREQVQAQQRLSRLTIDLTQAKDKRAALEATGSGSSVSLFASAAKSAEAALDAARKTEQDLVAKRLDTERTDQSARDALSDAKQITSKLEAERNALTSVLSRGENAHWTPALAKLTVKGGYEQALAAALGDDLDASIGEDAPMMWTGSTNAGSGIVAQSLPDGVTPLKSLVKAPDELALRLSQIGLVEKEHLANTSRLLKPGQRLVTRDGHVVRWDGFETRADAQTSAALKLQQRNRRDGLDIEIAAAREKVAQASLEFETARAARLGAERAAKDARQSLPDLERKDRAAQAALTQYETDVARETAEKRALEDRIERLEREYKDAKAHLNTVTEQAEALSGGQDFTAELDALSTQLSEARAVADEASAQYRTLKNESEARAARLKTVESERTSWNARSETAKTRVVSLQGRRDATQLTLSASKEGPDQFEARRNTLFSELAAAETRRKAAADSLAASENALRDAQARARTAEADYNDAREVRAGAQARLVAAQERVTETQARISETLACEPSELSEHLGELDPESKLSESDIDKKLDRLQQERERMGAVNLRADEEAEEQDARLASFLHERQDLEAAIARLREGIDALNSEGRTRLLKAFDVVNGHFGRLFTTLFGGGEASLALTESDDPLEAGLEVMVSPPGKKLGSMSLMSGGEQALTATALIFAVFLSNPAPICVLDEVDAPLDDANVARYCNLLDEMTKSTNTKFIAITHNAVTMSRMDRLFGVTMAEQGVSQLLSMELTQAAQLVAAE